MNAAAEQNIRQLMDLPPADQVGFVVPDMEVALKLYQPMFGEFVQMETPLEGALLRGQPEDCVLKLAFVKSGDLEIELIQPVSGKSPHQEFIDAGGNGMHHLRFRVEDHDAMVAKAEACGWQQTWCMRMGGEIAFSYLSRPEDSLFIEFLQMP